MLVCKLDASGTTDETLALTMAGYVGLFPAWIDFEIKARAVLDSYGVEFCHAKKLYATQPPFKGWGRTKKEAFVQDLQNCIVGRLDLGVTFSALKQEYERTREEHDVAHNESTFGYCFRVIVWKLVNDEILKRAIAAGESLTFILESGDANGEDARRVFADLQARPEYTAALASIGFADKKSSIGLQIADLLAFYSRRDIVKYDAQKGYAAESGIVTILRKGIYLIDEVAVEFSVP
jgi:hypothetical protein